MTIIRLFYPQSLSINFEANLDKSQSHYLMRVMRIKIGENFSLFNSTGEWLVKITKISKSIVAFRVIEKLKEQKITKEIWLAFSPIKSNYFNFMIQKATELGVTRFIPIIFDRTIVRKFNIERVKKIIIEATEQSNRINLPLLEKPQNLKNFLINNSKKIDLIFTDLNTSKKKLELKKTIDKPICAIVGPEGDFNENERKLILSFKDVRSININQNILRAETATISIISIINYILSL